MHYVIYYNLTEIAESCFKTEKSSAVNLDIIIYIVIYFSYYFRIQYEN